MNNSLFGRRASGWAQVHSAAGVAATLDGTRAMLEPVPVAASRLKLVIAGGGDTKSGTFDILVG